MKNKFFQSRDLCLRALDTNSVCAKSVRRNERRMKEFEINNENDYLPLRDVVFNTLRTSILTGELKPGEKMPSNRELAVLFKVNQNTAARIYREMESMGLCYTKRGIGTFVSEEDDMISGLKKEMAEELVRNFMQEMEDLGFQKGDIIDRIADYKEEEK